MLSLLAVARITYPRPEDLEPSGVEVRAAGLPRVFWIYLVGAALAGAGFADYPLIAFHLERSSTVGSGIVPIFYAVAMAISGLGSLAFGRMFDRSGLAVLVLGEVGFVLVVVAFAIMATQCHSLKTTSTTQ
jgi:predicted MFS family arabinose efflux permease